MRDGLDRDRATALYGQRFWRFLNAEERACFLLKVDRLWMPFLTIHQGVEIGLNRRVAADEYLHPRRLLEELTVTLPAGPVEAILERMPRHELPLLLA